MVVQGTDDSLVPYRTTTSLVDGSLCHAQHDTVRYVPDPRGQPQRCAAEGGPAILHWISSRLAGRGRGRLVPG